MTLNRRLVRLRHGYVCVAVALGLSLSPVASASILTVPATGPSPSSVLSAEATFELVGGILTVTLTNTSLLDVGKPEEILTAIFFRVDDGTVFNPVSAVLGAGSSVLFAPTTDVAGNAITGGTYAGGDVGAEWAYRADLEGANGTLRGISSTGLDLFGPHERFDDGAGRNLQGPNSPDGLQYGITSLGDDPLGGNSAVTGTFALIQHSVVFTFDGIGQGFSLDSIYGIHFQYGTSLSEPSLPVPEPATMTLLGMGLFGFACRRRRTPSQST